MTRARLRVVALLVGGLALAGCTASAQARHSAAPASPSSSTPAPSSTPPTTAASSSVASSAAPSTPAATSPAPRPTTSPAVPVTPRSTCTSVTVRVIRGSAAQGIEFAALQFTNAGSKACKLYGYPAATLRLRGKPIGSPAQPVSGAVSRITLQPGDTAESRLTDYTNCQAPLSDSVRVVVPGATFHVVRPAQLRACILRVSRLGQPE